MVVNGLTKQHAFEIGNGFYGLDIMKPQSQIMYGIKEFFAIILKFCTKSQDFVANINSSHLYCGPFGGDVFLNIVLIS